MSRKVIISLVGLVLILATGYGIHYASIHQPQVATQKSEGKGSSEPLAKLVYVGTNETLSEALYHLDLQDGKLDEPHIVHKFININKHILTFIDKDGKVKKEMLLEDKRSKIDVYITQNGKYARVLSDFNERDFSNTTQYYDVNGNLLWERTKAALAHYVSPNGKLIVQGPNWDYQIIHLERSYSLLDSKGGEIKTYKMGYKENNYGLEGIIFSSNASFYLMIFSIGHATSAKNLLILFDYKGREIYRKILESLLLDLDWTRITDAGFVSLIGIEADEESEISKERRKLVVLNKEGKELFSQYKISETAVVSDTKLCALGGSEVFLIDLDKEEALPVYRGKHVLRILAFDGRALILEDHAVNHESTFRVLLQDKKRSLVIYDDPNVNRYKEIPIDRYYIAGNKLILKTDIVYLEGDLLSRNEEKVVIIKIE